MSRLRRRLLLAAAAGPLLRAAGSVPPGGPAAGVDAFAYAQVQPRPLRFPRDFGAHPMHRIEWWYLTGQLDAAPDAGLPVLGLQLTFFRMRPAIDAANPSAFAAHQLILAHAALADSRRGTLLHDERIARAGFGLAQADTTDTAVRVDRWELVRESSRDSGGGGYRGRVRAAAFSIDLLARPTQPLLLQGAGGYSRKDASRPGQAPARTAASAYYSEPQLALEATVAIAGDTATPRARRGRGWLDHEWSSTLLPAAAIGWDWGGFNLDDGTALTFFRIRARAGVRTGSSADPGAGPVLHAYVSLRRAGRALQTFVPAQLQWAPLQYWTSPRSRARYPVAQALVVAGRRFEIRPLMDDQEIESRADGGFVYWEGACTLDEDGCAIGRGYLELTGYAGAALGGADRDAGPGS